MFSLLGDSSPCISHITAHLYQLLFPSVFIRMSVQPTALEERDNRAEKLFEEITAEIFPNLGKEIEIEIEEVLWRPRG